MQAVREQLEAAIRANPDDASTWQVYGDWLVSQGDARGEAIALFARLRHQTMSAKERGAAILEYEELTDPERWLTGCPEGLMRTEGEQTADEELYDGVGFFEDAAGRSALSELEWRHGFVLGATFGLSGVGADDESSGRTEDRLERIEKLSAFRASHAARLLQRVTLLDSPGPSLDALIASGLLGGLSSLRLVRLTAPDLAALFASDVLDGLRSLHIVDPLLEPEADWVGRLAEAHALRDLRTLSLAGCGLGPEGASVLAASQTLTALTALDLSDNAIGPKGAHALSKSSFDRLEALYLSGNAIADKGASDLADSAALRNLRVLDLESNDIGDRGAKMLAESVLCALTELDLDGNRITDKGLQRIMRSPVLHELRELRMRFNPVSGRYNTYTPPHVPTDIFCAMPHLTAMLVGDEPDMLREETFWKGEQRASFYVATME